MKRTHRFKVEQRWLESSRFPGSERRDLEASIYPRKRYHVPSGILVYERFSFYVVSKTVETRVNWDKIWLAFADNWRMSA